MAKFFTCILIYSLSSALYGQYISKSINPFQFTFSKEITSVNSDIVIGVANNYYFDALPVETFLYSLSAVNLATRDSVLLNGLIGNSQPSGSVYLGEIKVVDSLIVISAAYRDTGTSNQCMPFSSGLFFFDSDFNLKDEVIFKSLENSLFFQTFDFNSNFFILAGFSIHCDSSGLPNPALALINRQTNHSKWKDISDQLNYPKSHFESYRPKIVGESIYAHVYNHDARDFKSNVILDTNLTVKSLGSIAEPNSGPLFNTLNSHGQFIQSNQSIIQIGFSKSYFDTLIEPDKRHGYWNLAYTTLDSIGNVSKFDTLTLSGYDIKTSYDLNGNVPFNFDGIDYKTTDSICLVANTKFIDNANYNSKDTVSFYIYNLNLNNKTVNWSRKITRPLINGGQAVACLPNNRYAISFNQYDWVSHPNPNLETVVWILDSSGNIINEREFETTPKWSLYPNPSEGVFNLSKSWNHPKPYKVLDLQGRVQFEGILDPHSQQINLQDTSPGHYILLMDGQNIPLIKK